MVRKNSYLHFGLVRTPERDSPRKRDRNGDEERVSGLLVHAWSFVPVPYEVFICFVFLFFFLQTLSFPFIFLSRVGWPACSSPCSARSSWLPSCFSGFVPFMVFDSVSDISSASTYQKYSLLHCWDCLHSHLPRGNSTYRMNVNWFVWKKFFKIIKKQHQVLQHQLTSSFHSYIHTHIPSKIPKSQDGFLPVYGDGFNINPT